MFSILLKLLIINVLNIKLFINCFEFNDVNIFYVTDTHSWMNSHEHPDNKPLLDATYGNVTNFILNIKDLIKKDKKDIFFFDNGDVVDGTGLSNASPIDGEYLFPLLMNVPFDAMAIGNHECYNGDVINEMISSNYIKSRNGTYLTSNVLYTTTMEPLGDRYTVLKGSNSGIRLLVFGMLYNMNDNTDVVTIVTVEDTLKSDWFKDALLNENYDAIVVLFHIDFEDPLINTFLQGIRSIKGDKIPVQFLTGHSHLQGYNEPDAYSSTLEAGYYFNTLGYASFNISSSMDKDNDKMDFYHEYIDINIQEMVDIYTDMGGNATDGGMLTVTGLQLDRDVQAVRDSMDLSLVIGCSPQHYSLDFGLDMEHSLYGLFMHEVIPSQLFTPAFNETQIHIQGTGLLRYDLYKKDVTVDDIWTLSPFNDGFKSIINVLGKDLNQALDNLNGVSRIKHDTRLRSPIIEALPAYASSSIAIDSQTYDILACDFDAGYVATALEEVTGEPVVLNDYVKGDLTATTVWFSWANKYLNKTC